MAWIDCTERLPPVGVWVPVCTDYTPEGLPYPEACLRPHPYSGEITWTSDRWRAMVGVRYWWEEQPMEAPCNPA